MATKIVTKNSSTASAVPTASDLVQGELAVNVADKRLFTEDNAGAIVELGTNPYNFTANHDGSAKLATTSTGIDVTGTVTADGLTLDSGVYKINNTSIGSGSDKWIGSDGGAGVFVNAGTSGNFNVYNNNAVARLGINGSTGDISFYEDTGTTAKFFWDASAESLGIGQGVFSGTQALNLKGEGIAIKNDKSGSNNNWSLIRNTGTASTSNISFVTGSGEAMVLDHNRNVGIGTSSPSAGLELNLASGDGLLINSADIATIKMKSTGGSVKNWGFATTNLAASDFGIYQSNSNGGDPITAGTARMYFNASGNVGIGTSTDSGKLNIYRAGGETQVKIRSDANQTGNIYFTDATSGYSGSFAYDHTDDSMRFATNGTGEKMRIDASGNLQLGNTTGSRRLNVFSDTDRYTMDLRNESGYNSGELSGIVFSGKYDSSNNVTDMASIGGGKENTTDGNFGGRLSFFTRTHGGSDTERMRIDSSGNVGIGTSSPSYPFHLSGSGDTVAAVTAGASSVAALNLGNSTNLADGGIRYDNSANSLIFRASNAERMRIDSSGNVGIGTSSPSTRLSVRAGSANGIELDQDSDLATDSARLFFNSSSGGCSIFNTSGSLRFNSGATAGSSSGTERMRIDASGNLLVGKTATAFGTAGVVLRGDSAEGLIQATRANNECIEVNRTGSDGAIAIFAKDGTAVGSIGTISGKLQIDGPSNNSGIRFHTDSIIPTKNTAVINGGVDLGYNDGSTILGFRNLTLSGGVYLGGTGAANKLDDYEEGTWTPSLVGSTTAGTATFVSGPTGTYTKIGNQVTVYFDWNISAHTGAGALRVNGLPFTKGSAPAVGAVMDGYYSYTAGRTRLVPYIVGSVLRFYGVGDNVGYAENVLDVAHQINGSVTYTV